ncbi:MAG TPA: glutathione S-transferase N-terminal domain-containing protein [Candidatus Kryptonia bacterium]|nr:glutathione S-transferase N-terminal domain-containing protein [Candidatus Kryptonia bacterium]
MITLYGTSKSRASRSLVALEELGLSYKHVPLRPRSVPADRAILDKLNPNSHIPVLEDDGFVVWESMAINLYLADKCGGPLWPSDVRGRALVYQWSIWAQTERIATIGERSGAAATRCKSRRHAPKRSPRSRS